MHGSIARFVAQFKQSWSLGFESEAILAAGRKADHSCRKREMGLERMVKMYLPQVLAVSVACNLVNRVQLGTPVVRLPTVVHCSARLLHTSDTSL